MISILTMIISSLAFGLTSQSLTQPLYSMEKDSFIPNSALESLIIHESDKHYILRSPLTDFNKNDYYYIQLDEKIKDLTWLKDKGELVDHQESEFAILIPKNDQSLLDISTYLHEQGGHCGTLQKLSPMPIEFNKFDPRPLFTKPMQQVRNTIDDVSYKNIVNTIKTMVSWKTRYHKDNEGKNTAQRLKELYEAHLPENRKDVSIELYQHSGSPQPSLLVRITGQDKPEEIVILGSHLDSINNSNNKDAPGADDNASGTATNLEVFKALMENDVTPQKTIEIHAYAAEEIGLVGSGEMADQYKKDRKKVQAMLQFDMNGYSRDGQTKIYFVSNNTNSALNRQLGRLVDDYIKVPWDTQFLLFGSSDHASWNKRGFPVAFPTENPFAFNKNIHKSSDTLDNMNRKEQMEAFAQLGVAYFMHYAGF